ncbi:hypothetical protein BDW74DRAFT_177556 [Aspergillus multicolor]|uniref:uncharacterized protein n=1 Tax=Aspergillus multicolor TaxID=41759 RepID=UPI003CCDA94A
MSSSTIANPISSTSKPDPNSENPKKGCTTLITNTAYLPGLLTLEFSRRRTNSAYPLVALYTDTLPESGHAALDARGISKEHVPYLLPSIHKNYSSDTRFYDCWSKLTPFSLVEFERVVQLDCDMLVVRNMDELMEIELDGAELKGEERAVLAACHACVCNPLGKGHYPDNCAQLASPATASYAFADQSLLGDLLRDRWVALPYVYNALKTLRWEGVHEFFWEDAEVRNVHFILGLKPWEEGDEGQGQNGTAALDGKGKGRDPLHEGWWEVNRERLKEEKARGVDDGFDGAGMGCRVMGRLRRSI